MSSSQKIDLAREKPRFGKTIKAINLKQKQPSWSHQKELAELKGKKIELFLHDAFESTKGRLLEADQFTLKVFVETDQRAAIIFKSAIKAFWVLD